MNNTSLVLRILHKEGSINDQEAAQAGIMSLRKRIYDLRAAGHNIEFSGGRYFISQKTISDTDINLAVKYAVKYVRQLILNIENKGKNRHGGMTEAMKSTKDKLVEDLNKLNSVI